MSAPHPHLILIEKDGTSYLVDTVKRCATMYATTEQMKALLDPEDYKPNTRWHGHFLTYRGRITV